MLGVCFIVLPTGTANAVDNLNTVDDATYVQFGVEYQNIYWTADDADNYQKYQATNGNGNYRYVLTADCGKDLPGPIQFRGNAVIFDLNGYTYYSRFRTDNYNGKLDPQCTTIEFADSSAAGTGQIINGNYNPFVDNYTATTIIFSGGTYPSGSIQSRRGAVTEFVIRGGSFPGSILVDDICTFTVAPWVTATYDSNGALTGWTASGNQYQDYQLIGLTADTKSNRAKINACTGGGKYYFLMQDDWDLVAQKSSVDFPTMDTAVFDSHGYTITGGETYYVYMYGCNTVELTDSSLTGGRITIISLGSVGTKNLILSGNGTYDLISYNRTAENPLNITVRGVKYAGINNWGEGNVSDSWTVAPYLLVDDTGEYDVTITAVANDFAVSNSEIVAGVYNYAVGYVWGLTVGELSKLAMPVDQTYYLWARNADGAYEYLNIVYRDGAWVKIAPEISVA